MSAIKMIDGTYGELHARQVSLLKFKKDYPALNDIWSAPTTAIQKYEQNNLLALRHLMERQKEIYEKYVMKDEDGNYRMEVKRHPSEPDREMFLNAESAAAFDEEWKKLMDTKIRIRLQ